MHMEVDPSPLDLERLQSMQIYDEDFPLKLRVCIQPVIDRHQFNSIALDLNAEDARTVAYVDSICSEAYSMAKRLLDEIPRTSSEYVGIPELYNFIKQFEPRQFIDILLQKLALEREIMSTEIIQDEVESKKETITKIFDKVKCEIHAMTSIMDGQSKLVEYLDEFHSNLLHNRENLPRLMKNRPQQDCDAIREKVRIQKEKYIADLSSLPQNLTNDINLTLRKSEELLKAIDEFTHVSHKILLEFRVMNRKVLTPFLANLKSLFSSCKEVLIKLKNSIGFFLEKVPKSDSYNNSYQLYKDRWPDVQIFSTKVQVAIQDAEYLLLKNAVVISEEPDFSMRVLKKDKKLNNYEMLILLDRVHVSKANVKAHLLTEAGLRRIKNEIMNSKHPVVSEGDLGGDFKSKVASLDQESSRTSGYKLTFKDLTINKVNRKHKADQAVTQQKHVIMFAGQLDIDDISVQIELFSLPVIVAVHGNQSSKSLAAIFWDDYFPKDPRQGLEVMRTVNWDMMSKAISHLFHRELNREPTLTNLNYLRDRLRAENSGGQGEICFDAFAKGPKDTKLSFWEWLWGTLHVLVNDKTLLQLWRENYIVGYISQQDAKKTLNTLRSDSKVPLNDSKAERLFLIRFSESRKELITIQGHLYDSNLGWGVYSVKPYTAQDLKSISLPQRILDREDCGLVIFEENNSWTKKLKTEVFFESTESKEESSLPYGYIAWTLKERTGDSDIWKFRIDSTEDAVSDKSEINPIEEEFDLENGSLIDWLYKSD